MYLEHLIMSAGRRRDHPQCTRDGRRIWLARPPEDIKLSDIMRLVEGSMAPLDCVDNPDYRERSEVCVTREV